MAKKPRAVKRVRKKVRKKATRMKAVHKKTELREARLRERELCQDKVNNPDMTREEVVAAARDALEAAVTKRVKAGRITRHPFAQRNSPGPDKFREVAGPFNPLRTLDPIHVVRNGARGYWAFEGATRVEACIEDPDWGPDTVLSCRIYGNGGVPVPVVWELFLIPNSDRVPPPAHICFEASAFAQRPDAVFAKALVDRLGTKYKGTTGVWNLVKRLGEEPTEEAVDFVLETWGTRKHTPQAVLDAVAEIMANRNGPGSAATRDWEKLHTRRKALRRTTPDQLKAKADIMRLSQSGRRLSARAYVVKKLLGLRA